MKKSILLIAIFLFAICVNAQIKSFTIDGSKVYENGTRTAYLTIDGDFDADLASVVTEEIKSNPDFKNFSFYAAPDFSKIMFTVDKSLTEQMVVDLVNEVAFGLSTDSILFTGEFTKINRINDIYSVSFIIVNVQSKDIINEIYYSIKSTGKFVNINISDTYECELFSQYEISFPEIYAIILNAGADISPEFFNKSIK